MCVRECDCVCVCAAPPSAWMTWRKTSIWERGYRCVSTVCSSVCFTARAVSSDFLSATRRFLRSDVEKGAMLHRGAWA